MWVQVSLARVFIQSTHARTCVYVFARLRWRVTARTRTLPCVRPCKILSSFTPHRLHLVYPCREERRQMSESFSSPFSSLSLSSSRERSCICRRATQKYPTIVATSTKEDYLGSFLQRRLFRFARTKYQSRVFASILFFPRGSRIKLDPIFLVVANLLFRDMSSARIYCPISHKIDISKVRYSPVVDVYIY